MKKTYLSIAAALACAIQATCAHGQDDQVPPSLSDYNEPIIGSGLASPPERVPLQSTRPIERLSPSDLGPGETAYGGSIQERELPLLTTEDANLPLPSPPAPARQVAQPSVPSCNCEPHTHHVVPCAPAVPCTADAPFALFANTHDITVGGWTQFGYHSENGGLRFNQHADRVNLHQAWLFAEKAIDPTCGFDIGGRIDYVYGVDAQDTQAFGLNNDHWDNGWDNGIYGHALPQMYFEAGYGNFSAKVGKFFTIIGNEVVAAPDNFFYSHAYTMYNSEPFTHTGVLLTYSLNENVTMYGGYTLGWDSGFEDNGDSFLGGISVRADDTTTLTYATVIGRFGEDAGLTGTTDEMGYMHSLVLTKALSDQLTYIFQTDYLDTRDAASNQIRNTRGIAQYLLYQFNDRWAMGSRFEWWNFSEDSVGYFGDNANLAALAAISDRQGSSDVYALTLGLNYRPHNNVLIRPEVRWDFVKEDRALLNAADITINENNDSSQTTFGIDTIFIF